jgi:hypothetical protein
MKHNYEFVSQRIREAMAEKNISIRDLARHIQSSYENTRFIIHGRRRLPEPITRLVCEYLEIKPEEVDRLRTFDELNHQASSQIPSFTPMERFWGYLTDEHRQDLVCLARRWAGQDRGVKRGAEESDEDDSSLTVRQ